MREDVVTTKVYSFDELSDEAKEKAIEKLYDINVLGDWWDGVYDDAETIGLEISEFNLDRGAFCRGTWTEDAEGTAQLILNNHGEDCETHKVAKTFLADLDKTFLASDDCDLEYAVIFEEFTESDEYEELCKEFQRMICEDYRIILQKEYEYLIGEEAVVETIKANGYEFTVDGTQY